MNYDFTDFGWYCLSFVSILWIWFFSAWGVYDIWWNGRLRLAAIFKLLFSFFGLLGFIISMKSLDVL